ncbi:MAG: hypothetical protein OXI22_16315 [Defluviicoccus sp.]|nr:hypothetical protein [Defluviicoccus sp.]MDE0385450.1 hypothetical protein [Defluviicoccus sp.]
MSSSDDGRAPDLDALGAATETALAIAEKALDDGATEAIPDEMVQRLLTAGVRLFANKVEMEDRVFRPFVSAESATATDVVVTVTEMLHAANLNTFDLAMWFRRPRPGTDD